MVWAKLSESSAGSSGPSNSRSTANGWGRARSSAVTPQRPRNSSRSMIMRPDMGALSMIGFRAVKERKGETAWGSAQLLCLRRDPSGRCLADHLPESPRPRSHDRGTLVSSGCPLWLRLGGVPRLSTTGAGLHPTRSQKGKGRGNAELIRRYHVSKLMGSGPIQISTPCFHFKRRATALMALSSA